VKKISILITILLYLFFFPAFLAAQTVARHPYGAAVPRLYDISTYGQGTSIGSYYLDFPTLSANDTITGLTTTQTLTNKTITAPTIDTITFSAGTLGIFEGSTADAYETTVSVTDPTADNTITIPNTTGALITSSLTTNLPDAANSVTGTSNGVLFEGATADGYETTLTPADPTADRTITIPDAITGTLSVISVTAHAATGNLTAAECYGGIVTNTGAGAGIVLTLPVAVVGMKTTIWLTAAQDVDINPQDGTTILALTDASGDAISSAATIGNTITLVALSTTSWGAISSSGTWSDAN
jgi:hypothetical protein